MPRPWIFVLALALGALCWGRGYPLLEPDEGRNVEVAREMARDGDWVLPHLDGLPYLDKPATYFAAVALSLKVFGESEGAARLPSLLFTFGSIALAWRLGRRMGRPGAGEIAALALATMPLAMAFSRTVIFDPALAFLETLTLFGAWHALDGRGGGERWAALTWAAMGVGAIVKGPVAIIVPLLVLASFALAAGVSPRPLLRWRAWPWLFVTSLPWFIAVSLRRPDFPYYAFVHESLQRVATKALGRGGPIWYFIPVALAGSFPWSVPAIAAAAHAWRGRAQRRSAEGRAAVFLAAWALVPLVFFSLSQSKLPGYYLPALPAIALAAGILLARARAEGAFAGAARTAALVTAAILMVLGVALVPAAGSVAMRLPTELQRQEFPGFALDFGVVLCATALALVLALRRRDVLLASAVLALPVIALPFAGRPFLDAVGRGRSSKDLVAAIERKAPRARVVGANAWPTSLRYYLDRPVLLASGSASELTSNYIISRLDEFRAAPDSPLRPADWWRGAMDACETPTVFVTHVRTPEDTLLAARLPRIAVGGADEKFVAYGPCVPPVLSAGPQPPTPNPQPPTPSPR
jgi:4-amino-4-deoxy-L-arabinose transferase-like glycosyltransferase